MDESEKSITTPTRTMSQFNSSEVVVKVENVTKEYRRDEFVVPVLAGMNLELKACDYTALMGPSGSGKSTLLNLSLIHI